jgi:hypothetical protein
VLLTGGTDSIKDTHVDWGTGATQVSGADIPLDVTNFDTNLSATDTTVQTALETLDEMVAGAASVEDAAFDNTWNADTDGASKNAIYDRIHLFDADDDGDFTNEAWFPSTSGAPASATYITQVAEAGLSAEQALADLATGLVKNTTETGVLSIAAAGTDYLAPGGDGSALTSVDAATGDSATAFFDAGTIEHERGGLEADVSAYGGLVKISGGATSAVTDNSANWNSAYNHSVSVGTDHTYLGQNVSSGQSPILDGTNITGVASVDTADTVSATTYVGLYEGATGAQAPKTDAGLTYNATTGIIGANGISGNAATASALVADPDPCQANTWATDVNAAGDLTCGAVTYAGITAMTSSNLAGIITNESGTGPVLFGTNPTITTPTITTPTLTLEDGNGSAPTADGQIKYDRTAEVLQVGDGTTTKTFTPMGTDDNYVTDAEKIVIGNTSGTNTGDNAANTTYADDYRAANFVPGLNYVEVELDPNLDTHESNYQHTNLPTADQKAAFPVGATALNQLVVDDDSRLTDARLPTAHADSHGAGQADAITITEAQISDLAHNPFDPASPGAIGGTTPAAGDFTEIEVFGVDMFDPGLVKLHDSAQYDSGQYLGLSAPDFFLTDGYTLIFPIDQPTAGDALVKPGAGAIGTLGWESNHLTEAEVDAYVDNNGYLTTETDPTAEPALGNPASDGYLLSSTVAGVRSWVADGGSVDLTEPGPIGSVTPSTGEFTDLIADSFSLGQPASGQTGEISMPEDPDNGANVVGFKAPAALAADLLFEMPGGDGTSGQSILTDGNKTLYFGTPAGGSVDLTEPGPIGSVTPSTGEFTDLIAATFDWGTPAGGTTGELVLFEDPDNGGSSLTLKAPADIAADVVWTLPATDGASGQVLTTNAAGIFAWSDAVLDSDIGAAVQAYDADLADLADGSLTGTKVGSGINGTNITSGTVAEARLDAAIARDSEVTAAPVAAPTTATDTCTAGTWAYDASYIYVCSAADTWLRAAIATW